MTKFLVMCTYDLAPDPMQIFLSFFELELGALTKVLATAD
jgi:hypothetical protein